MRSVYLVIREPGRLWLPRQPLERQPDWAAHAEFMGELFNAGRLLFGGPLREVSGKVVLVMAADSRDAVRELLERDPWQFGAVIRTVSVTTWDWAQEATRRAA